MNKAFEKILERLDAKKQYFQKFYEEDGKTEEDEYINKATQLAFDDAKNIVQEVAEEYNFGWIPCCERLPEVGQIVLANVRKPSKYVNKCTPIIITEYKDVYYWRNGTILAWQSLPEPFKESD